MVKQRKVHICPICSGTFVKYNSTQKVCHSVNCALEYARRDTEAKKLKEERKRLKIRKLELKPKGYFMKKAQDAFNAFIRTRDEGKPCISCGQSNPMMTRGGQWDCGHFLSVGSHPELRFEEKNAYRQCKSCNGGSGKFSHVNHTVSQRYEANLIAEYGQELVDWLKGPHKPKNYTREDYQRIEKYYKEKRKELLNQVI